MAAMDDFSHAKGAAGLLHIRAYEQIGGSATDKHVQSTIYSRILSL